MLYIVIGWVWCCVGGEVLELIMGVIIFWCVKFFMVLLIIKGGGVGDVILVWGCCFVGLGLGNMVWWDMCEFRGDFLGKGRLIWFFLWEKRNNVSKCYIWFF